MGCCVLVALPAGQWRVEWRFEPVIAYLGLAISLLTAGLVGVMLWRGHRAAQREKQKR